MLGIKTVKDLEHAAKTHKIRDLRDFTAKTEERILAEIKKTREREQRFKISTAEDLNIRIHWAFRDASINGRPPIEGFNLDVIMERPKNSLSRDELRKVSDGRVYTAGQALQVKLIDRIGYLDDVIVQIRTAVGDEKARVVSYYRPGNYKGSIYAGAAEKAGLAEALSGFDAISGSSFMYLWRP